MPRKTRTNIVGVAMIGVAIVGAFAVRGCSAGAESASTGAAVTGVLPAAGALTTLDRIPVAAAGSMTGYTRAKFGAAWADTDGNGCDTRNDILARDAARTGSHVVKADACKVTAIEMVDPYTGATLTKSEIDIDHVVPLAVAWRSGASGWAPDRRTELANDPRNLIAASDKENRKKSDKTPDAYMPPNPAEACPYASAYLMVVDVYQLTITGAVKAKLSSALEACG